MKSHRIPKFLTKPWEKDGKFKVFCFKEKKISTKNAGYFFAEDDLFTQYEEEFWNKNVETPLADFFRRISYKEEPVIRVENFKHIRAMHWLLPSIVERSWKKRLKKSIDFSEKNIESSMMLFHQKYKLLILNTPLKEHRLLFPETGFFPIVFLTKENIPSVVQAVPILGNRALISISNEIDNNDIVKVAKNGEHLINVSVSNLCDKVIVHPDMLKHKNEEEIIQILCETRQNYCYYIDLCRKLDRTQKN